MHVILTRGGVLAAVVASACAKAQQVQDDKAGSGTVPPESALQVRSIKPHVGRRQLTRRHL